jgi:hypothetical protein
VKRQARHARAADVERAGGGLVLDEDKAKRLVEAEGGVSAS